MRIHYDPLSAGAEIALQRFLRFLRQEFLTRFSMGCDMGTHFDSIERMARAEGIPSVKYAVKVAQDLSEEEFFARLRLLDERIGALTLGQRRAGHALAHAVFSRSCSRVATITPSADPMLTPRYAILSWSMSCRISR